MDSSHYSCAMLRALRVFARSFRAICPLGQLIATIAISTQTSIFRSYPRGYCPCLQHEKETPSAWGRLIAIGDIHGCSLTLKAMLDRLALTQGETLVVTGDLSAKGIDSSGVHQQLVELEHRGIDLIILIGNHELMLLALQRFIGASFDLPDIPSEMLREAEIPFLIRGNGGWATLKSYGFDRVDDRSMWAFDGDDLREHFSRVGETLGQLDWVLPAAHLELLSKCKTHHIERNCLFVHAGLAPQFLQFDTAEAAVQAQIQSDVGQLCWTRDWLGKTPTFNELLVHGHTR